MQRNLNSYIECVNVFAVIFADPQREGYKLHSLLGSVGKRAETNFNFPAPPFNHISGICKNLADTWPAATRVLSRGRKREDPGNEVGSSPTVTSQNPIPAIFRSLYEPFRLYNDEKYLFSRSNISAAFWLNNVKLWIMIIWIRISYLNLKSK